MHAEEKLKNAGLPTVDIDDFAAGPLTLEHAESPWLASESLDVNGLQELGFVPRKMHQSTWTEAAKTKLQHGLADWASVGATMPGPNMGIFWYLHQHVMDKTFSQAACQRMVNHLDVEVRQGKEGSAIAPAIRHAPALEGDSESDRADQEGSDQEGSDQEGESDSDSADEVDLQPDVIWECDTEDH